MNHNNIFVLFNIPLALQQQVLGSWLTIKDVAKMDSAMCLRESRPMLLELLSKRDMVLINHNISKAHISSWMAWMVARKASVSRCRLSKAVAPALYIPFFIHTGEKLETLTITSEDEDAVSFTQMLSCAAPYCTNVKEISLKKCLSVRGLENILYISERSIITISMEDCNWTGFEVGDFMLPSLKRLRIIDCTNITNTTLKQLLQAAHNLEILIVFKLNAWSADIRYSQYLRVISITISNITHTMLCSIVNRCPLLEVVLLSECTQLTDVSIIELVQHAKHLTALYLSSNSNFTDAALEAIAVHCGERLRHLCVDYCESITDAGLHHISERCHGLLGLGIYISEMGPITTAAIQELLRVNPLLQEVGMEGIHDADAMLLTLAENCSQLRYLDIYTLEGYTEIGTSAIFRSCTQLRTVKINLGCTVINPFARYLWEHCCPGLVFAFENVCLSFWCKLFSPIQWS